MTSLSRQYAKLCDLRDFEDPEILAMIRSIVPERDPLTHIERKVWEFAMLALFLDEVGRLHDATDALSVGAGNERILFWLANRIGRMVATDIYGEGSFADREAEPSMLADPASHAPYPYREDHLEVLRMDARELAFADDTFDIVFTLSSIEHFGTPEDIASSARELGRVLKPGGHAIVVTDWLVRHDPVDRIAGIAARLKHGPRHQGRWRRGALAETFTRRELRELIVAPSGLRELEELDTTVSPGSWGQPMLFVPAKRSMLTSVCLVLEKP